MSYQQIAQAKKEAVEANIPSKWRLQTVPTPDEEPNCRVYLDKVLPAEEVKITSSRAVDLLSHLASGQLKAVDVAEAFCHRAALAHQLTTCCSEIFFEKALERAKELDRCYEKNGKPIGRLHGLPISLKDQFNIEGVDTTMGFVSKINQPKSHEEQSLLVDILLEEGAILYVKTTLPTTMMTAETYSHIYGFTLNSVNRHVSPGGSSGGEGALIAAGGSLIGFGTDIGGSVRIPSSMNGLYGLRASSGRFPYLNVSNTMADNPVLSSIVGPMCTHLEDLELISKVLIANEPWLADPKTPPIVWRPAVIPERLKIGVLVKAGDFIPVPAVRRTLDEFVQKLKDRGHETVEVDELLPVKFTELSRVIGRIYSINGYHDVKEEFKKGSEPYTPMLEHIADLEPTDVLAEWELSRLRYEYQVATTKFLRENDFDCILAPVWGEGGFVSGGCNHASNYNTVFNLLDFSSITLPGGVYQKTDVWEKPHGDAQARSFEHYDLAKLTGTPIGLQIACLKYEEEKCVEICKLLSGY